MSFLKTFLTASALVVTIAASAQTVDEIVAKNITAMGGKEKLLTLKTVKMTGGLSVQGADVAIVNTKSQNTGSRMDIEVMGTSNYVLGNTTKGWTFMPIFGMPAPQEMTAGQLQGLVALMDIQSPFLNYKEKGNAIVLKGSEKVEGSDAWKLEVTFKNGKVINYFIDQKTNFVVKTTSIENMNGQDETEEIFYSDYKQNAAGYWFAYGVTNERGTTVFSNIETNIAVDESLFKN